MKREFIKEQVPDISKEALDAIMAENGRDIEAAKRPFADYEAIKEQLRTAKEGLSAFEGVDVQQLRAEIETLNKSLEAKDVEWQTKLDEMTFEAKVKDAVAAAKGKNAKAIMAMLDMAALKASNNQDADVESAVKALKESDGYLFEEVAPVTGAWVNSGASHGSAAAPDYSQMSDEEYYDKTLKKE